MHIHNSPTLRKHVVIFTADDWAGVYVDGKLIDEGHSVNMGILTEELGIHSFRIDEDERWEKFNRDLWDGDSFPEKLENVPGWKENS